MKKKYTVEQRREKGRLCSKNYRKNPEKREIILKYKKIVLNRNRAKLFKLRREKGNRCVLCGYNEEPRILVFHHLRDKKFGIGSNYYRSLDELREEVKKCILLCPNCHAKVHLN